MAAIIARESKGLRRWAGIGFAVPAVLLLLFFFVLPVFGLLLRSVTEPQFGLQNYAELFATSTYARVLFNTFLVAGVVTLFSLLLGFPVGFTGTPPMVTMAAPEAFTFAKTFSISRTCKASVAAPMS